jgi:hypothetical protein
MNPEIEPGAFAGQGRQLSNEDEATYVASSSRVAGERDIAVPTEEYITKNAALFRDVSYLIWKHVNATNEYDFDDYYFPIGENDERFPFKGTHTAREWSEIADQIDKVLETIVTNLASAYHEDWRKSRQREGGSFEPLVETTKDEVWIEANGTDQVDIANTDFAGLPADWRAEKEAAAEAAIRIIDTAGGDINLGDQGALAYYGALIHDARLANGNNWEMGRKNISYTERTDDQVAEDISWIEITWRIHELGRNK